MQEDRHGVSTEMPRYKSHKEVWALKIKQMVHLPDSATVLIHFDDEGFAPKEVSKKWVDWKVSEVSDPGYFVVYADGYESWSPTGAFESGYTPIT